MFRRRRFWKVVLGLFVALVSLLVYAAWPGKSTFTVSPETTYVTGPLDKHGYVDYVAALNERLRGDIRPEQNANVLIWQALGPRPEGGEMPAEYFKWLGIDPPPEEGEYLITFGEYLKSEKTALTGQERYDSYDRLTRAGKWPWVAVDEPELAGWLKRVESPLAVIIEASRRPDYYNPLVPERTEDWSPGLLETFLPNVQRCREIVSALCARAMYRVKEGKPDQAWQDLLACHRLARLVGRSGTLIELLVGFALDDIAGKASASFLDHAKLSQEQLRDCLRDLDELPPMPHVADRLDFGERFFLLDIVIQVAKQGVPFLEDLSRSSPTRRRERSFTSQFFTRNINWDSGLRKANQFYDRCAAAARLPDRAARRQEWAAIEHDIKELKRETQEALLFEGLIARPARRGELMINLLMGLLMRPANKVRDAEDRREQSRRNLRLAFALAVHRHDHGRYPAALAELASKYIDKVPDDLFSGQPLNYRPKADGYLLYSVGPNEIDDNGRGHEDEPRGDDIAVRMPVPEPAKKP